ncbi:tail fiber protein [Salmonella enterica]|nr:tail fiber protein [Salmonella enterica subsp. enterica serovar Muenchen]EHR0294456.1 tail fiber protein [Salmonella enterica]
MGKLTELEQWDEDIYQIETSDPVLGGPEGLSNRPQKQLANRTQWLKKQLEDANNALAEHEKSRNHPDATLTDKGFVKLYSGVTSMDETMAATPKAVKIAMDNANERLAKARNLADLQSVPLALANLTLADVKKYVESTNTGVSKLPLFRPSSEDDLTSLPAGYMALVKNSTPGGPLPDENWFYLEVAGNLDNSSNNPNRKGAVIRLIQVSTPEISWMGVKFDDGTTTTAKFRWSRDFNTLNKPTPEDVGLAATKKAVDDTQTGLAAQPVMWISTVDDLSNLPSGAHRFASNKAPATVLPAAGYFFLEVLSKRDVANGSCILATSDAGNVWIGLRYTAPTDTAFTWIQLNQNVENLGLTEAVKRANNAVQKDGDTMSAPLVNTHPDAFRLKQPGRSFFWRFDGATLYLLRTAINDPDGGWDTARPLYVNADSGQVYLGPDTKINGNLYVGDARVATNGNIYGIAWGGWLSDYLNIQFGARDNSINVRATIDWVNQNFVNDIFLGVEQYYSPGSNTISWIFHAPNGHVLTGINVSDTGSNSADNINGVYYKAIQKKINGVLMTIAG